MRARLRGTEIYFDVEGMGLVPDGNVMRERPVALMIHGGPGGDHSGFKPAFTPLAHSMQLVYFDHRGQGRSAEGDPDRYTLDENVEDMEALRQHLGLGPIVSIGTSYGGIVAMAHAIRYPDSVSQLVLIVTAAHGGFIAQAKQIVRARGTAEQQHVCDMLWAGELDTAERLSQYYDVMGPLYARNFDAGSAAAGRARGTSSPVPLNRAFGPGGFHAQLRPSPPARGDHGADTHSRRPARLDLCAGIFRGNPPSYTWVSATDLREQQPLHPFRRTPGDDRGHCRIRRPQRVTAIRGVTVKAATPLSRNHRQRHGQGAGA